MSAQAEEEHCTLARTCVEPPLLKLPLELDPPSESIEPEMSSKEASVNAATRVAARAAATAHASALQRLPASTCMGVALAAAVVNRCSNVAGREVGRGHCCGSIGDAHPVTILLLDVLTVELVQECRSTVDRDLELSG